MADALSLREFVDSLHPDITLRVRQRAISEEYRRRRALELRMYAKNAGVAFLLRADDSAARVWLVRYPQKALDWYLGAGQITTAKPGARRYRCESIASVAEYLKAYVDRGFLGEPAQPEKMTLDK